MPALEPYGRDRLIENVEMGIIKPDGDLTWTNVTAAPLGDRVIMTYNDITERKQAEASLKQIEWMLSKSPTPDSVREAENS